MLLNSQNYMYFELSEKNAHHIYNLIKMNYNFRKRTVSHLRPAKIQISLQVWLESSLGTFCEAKATKFLHADNEDWSDCADVQADFSLRRAHMPVGTFSYVAGRIIHPSKIYRIFPKYSVMA